jgi:hypothetical protein
LRLAQPKAGTLLARKPVLGFLLYQRSNGPLVHLSSRQNLPENTFSLALFQQAETGRFSTPAPGCFTFNSLLELPPIPYWN